MDPLQHVSCRTKSPLWSNAYAFVSDDPVNRFDPTGRAEAVAEYALQMMELTPPNYSPQPMRGWKSALSGADANISHGMTLEWSRSGHQRPTEKPRLSRFSTQTRKLSAWD
jgi:hypothetical protein